MKYSFIFFGIVAAAISGCKTELSAEVNYSQLSSKTPVIASASLIVEVPSCSSFEDSRKESETLVDVKKTISNILPESKFNECYSQNMNSYASFSTPVSIGDISGDAKINNGIFYVGGNKETPLYVFVPPALRKKIVKAKEDSLIGSSISFDLYIVLKNDTKDSINIKPVAAFLGTFPIIKTNTGIELKPGKEQEIKLSDVSVAMSLNSNYDNNVTPVIVE